jgi:hypothetical protein
MAKSRDDFEKMGYYAGGIQRAQKWLKLPIDSFPNLDLCALNILG